MKEVLPDIDRWRSEGKRVAVARVVGAEGSSPRLPGATMVVSDTGEVAGSVSGGCVEAAVLSEALDVLVGEGKAKLCAFGYSDDDAFAVGLPCGGTIRVLVEALDRCAPSTGGPPPAGGRSPGLMCEDEQPVDPPGAEVGTSRLLEVLSEALRAEEPVALAEVVEGPDELLGAKLVVRPGATPISSGSLGDPDLDRVVMRDALGELSGGLSVTRHYGSRGEARRRDVSVFIESFAPPPTMIIFGAVDFTAALAKVAKVLGYRVTVCDARAVFATRARFSMADEVVVAWPGEHLAEVGHDLGPRDAVCVLTHDPKFDLPAIVGALATDVGYLGAMGSRRTADHRNDRLRAAGVSDAELRRVMAPIGLDVGARTPEETAVAICAEIIALRTGRGAPSLRDRSGPIHRDPGPGDTVLA